MAGSSASSRRPVANATAIGTHSASTARAIVPHGTGAFFGRITSASHSGTTSSAQSGTPSRPPKKLRTRTKAKDSTPVSRNRGTAIGVQQACRSMQRETAGPALAATCPAVAAACLALALTACASGRTVSADHSPTSSSASRVRLLPPASRRRAQRRRGHTTSATQTLNAARRSGRRRSSWQSFAPPPGAHRLAGPPNAARRRAQAPRPPTSGLPGRCTVTDFWEAPGDPQALLAWEQARLTPRFILGDVGFGPPVWDRGFQLAPAGPLVTRELDVAVASAGDGQTGIRVDAWVAWQPPRPAASLIPAAARTVTIAESSSGDMVTPGGPTAKSLPAPVTITNPATVRGLTTLINGLPLSTIPPDAPCPATIDPFLTLTFRARPGGPALAIVQTDQPCDGVTLTVGGEQQPTLESEPTLDGRILKLAALPWKLPSQADQTRFIERSLLTHLPLGFMSMA